MFIRYWLILMNISYWNSKKSPFYHHNTFWSPKECIYHSFYAIDDIQRIDLLPKNKKYIMIIKCKSNLIKYVVALIFQLNVQLRGVLVWEFLDESIAITARKDLQLWRTYRAFVIWVGQLLKWKRHYLSLQSWHSRNIYDVWISHSQWKR